MRSPAEHCLPRLVCGLLILTFLVYLPGVFGPFIFDDLPNITQNEKIFGAEPSLTSFWQAVWSVESGPLHRPLAMASFTLNAWLWGEDSFSFKLTNLLLHVVNVGLVFVVSRKLYTRVWRPDNHKSAAMAALICAAFFALHPINFTSVLYVVQRMTSLATAFMLLALWCQLVLPAASSTKGRVGLFLGYFAFTALGVLSKENALLVVPVSLWIEFCLRSGEGGDNRVYRAFVACLAAASLAGVVLILMRLPQLAESYGDRPYTMYERLLTESRVVFFYLFEIFVPRIKDMSLFHDDFQLSTGLLEPVTTLFSVIGIIIVISLALAGMSRFGINWRILALVLGWFLVGHSMESTVIPLELVYDHRNYFPMIGIGLGVGYLATTFLSRHDRYKRLVYSILCLWLGVLALLTALRSESWRSTESTVIAESSRQPHSPRAQEAAANYYATQVLEEGGGKDHPLYSFALHYFNNSIQGDPGSITGLIGVIEWHQRMGIEGLPEWYEMLWNRLATQKFHGYELGRFVELMICQVEEDCHIPAQDFSRWITALLENPNISLARKAMIANTATGLAVSYGVLDIALYYAQKAVEWAPDEMEFMITLAILAHKLNKTDIRDAALETILRSDPSSRVIERLRNSGITINEKEEGL